MTNVSQPLSVNILLDAARGALSQADYIHNRKAQQVSPTLDAARGAVTQADYIHNRKPQQVGSMLDAARGALTQADYIHNRKAQQVGTNSEAGQRHKHHRYMQIRSGKHCMSTTSMTADPHKETLLSREPLQIHSGKLCRSTQRDGWEGEIWT